MDAHRKTRVQGSGFRVQGSGFRVQARPSSLAPRLSSLAAGLLLLTAVLLVSLGAKSRSDNFIVETADANLAGRIAQAAEKNRHDLAIEWLGKPMPNWAQPCQMTVQAGPNLGAGGATTFVFDQGEVFGWRMTIQGSPERIFDSVLPHEVTHMIFASHFRQPLPRWADEGGATSVECSLERQKHNQMLSQFLRSGRGIAFSRMFEMKDYPPDVMPLYAQGYSLAEFLIETGGRRKYVDFLGEGLQTGNWPAAVKHFYGSADLGALQNTWLAWVAQGSPPLRPQVEQPAAVSRGPELLAAATRRPRPEPNLILRVRDKLSPAAPRGELVPVAFSDVEPGSPQPAAPPATSVATAAGQLSVAAAEAKPLPPAGWHAVGTPAPEIPPAALAASPPPATAFAPEPLPAQVARPQPIERPKQTILEWNRR
jgi:hypothetical protein